MPLLRDGEVDFVASFSVLTPDFFNRQKSVEVLVAALGPQALAAGISSGHHAGMGGT